MYTFIYIYTCIRIARIHIYAGYAFICCTHIHTFLSVHEYMFQKQPVMYAQQIPLNFSPYVAMEWLRSVGSTKL